MNFGFHVVRSVMYEVWKDCPNYEGLYEISSLGRVRRAISSKPVTCTKPGNLLKPILRPSGYQTITLFKEKKGKVFFIHTLICHAWHGPRPSPKHRVAHFDGNASNNNYHNLRWATQSENEQDKKRHGTYHKGRFSNGSNNPSAKLTESDIPTIKQLRAEGLTYRQIASRFGVSYTPIHLILTGKKWKHVT